jgi:hypothetical protein
MRTGATKRVAVTSMQWPRRRYKQLAPSGKSPAYPDHRKNSKKAAPAKTVALFCIADPASGMRRQKAGAQGLGTGSDIAFKMQYLYSTSSRAAVDTLLRPLFYLH